VNSSSRNGATVRCLAIHTTEGIMRAADLRDWTSWAGSSHASCDETGALLDGAADGFVDYARAAWTIRNGNPWTDNLEICGWARWTRSDWLARPKLLEAVAVWLARRSTARGIPLQHLTVDKLRAGHRGCIDHDDYSDATGDGTHWDVGESFPWDVVLPRAVVLAGGSPPPAPVIHRRRPTMYLIRNTQSGGIFLATDRGLIHLQSVEEVNCMAWLLDPSRPPNATLHHNARFALVCQRVLSRPVYALPAGAAAGSGDDLEAQIQQMLDTAPAPEEPEDPDGILIQPPPGAEVFLTDAPDHGITPTQLQSR
jgi:hypothetical protein